MKICLCNNLYGEFSHGGAETVVSLMVSELKKSGHEVFLITTKPRKTKLVSPEKEIKDSESELKIYYIKSQFYNIADLNTFIRLFWHFHNIFSINKYFKIKKILKKEKPDVVITHNLMGLGFLAPLAIRKLKIRHEHFLHDIQLLHPSGLMIYGQENKLNSFAALAYQKITKSLFSSPAKIISPSKWLLDMHIDRGFFEKSAVEIRPFDWGKNNGALKEGEGNNKDSNKPKSSNKFLFVGQIEEQKGIFLLINAFKKIAKPELSLTIISRNGGGKLAEAIKLTKDDQRIKIISPLSFEETKKIMENSDCLIVPSLCYENSPTVIYGAHEAGLRVIASDIGGIPEICNENDDLFEPGNEEDLISRLSTTSSSPS
ncbi:MAG: glycosyltransferase [Patescibacteria group bacterium]